MLSERKPLNIERIPLIHASNIPWEIQGELRDWKSDISLHHSTAVEYVREDDLAEIPNFTAWMVEVGAWTRAEVDALKDPNNDNCLKFGLIGT